MSVGPIGLEMKHWILIIYDGTQTVLHLSFREKEIGYLSWTGDSMSGIRRRRGCFRAITGLN